MVECIGFVCRCLPLILILTPSLGPTVLAVSPPKKPVYRCYYCHDDEDKRIPAEKCQKTQSESYKDCGGETTPIQVCKTIKYDDGTVWKGCGKKEEINGRCGRRRGGGASVCQCEEQLCNDDVVSKGLSLICNGLQIVQIIIPIHIIFYFMR